MYKFIGKNGELYKFDPNETIMKLNYRCEKGTIEADSFSCGNTPEERKKNYNKQHPEKTANTKTSTKSESLNITNINTLKDYKALSDSDKIKFLNNKIASGSKSIYWLDGTHINNIEGKVKTLQKTVDSTVTKSTPASDIKPENKQVIKETKSVIQKVKKEKASGRVSKETKNELVATISKLKNTIPTNNNLMNNNIVPKTNNPSAFVNSVVDKLKLTGKTSDANAFKKAAWEVPDTLAEDEDLMSKLEEVAAKYGISTKINNDNKLLNNLDKTNFDTQSRNILSKLNNTQLTALSKYTIDSTNINKYLQTGKGDIETINYIKELDAIIDQSIIPEDAIVLRGVANSGWDKLDKTTGAEFNYKGYMSTTTDNRILSDYLDKDKNGKQNVVEIHVKRGTRGIYLGKNSIKNDKIRVITSQKETLIGRNTKMKVIGYREESDRNVLIYETIPDNKR